MASPGAPVLPDATRSSARAGGIGDRYRSLFDVGRGGMGSVEVALERGESGFERIVALKRLLPDQARDPRHKQMFLGEARLAALLRHPKVVHAFAYGDIYGELFLAMEYVEGETLARTLATYAGGERGLDPATVAFVLADACEGLHAAHELRDETGAALNVVHRDVSPHNVMIAYDGHIKILDFGVAKFDSGGHESRTGEVKGKMAYMSPEQALGEPLDRRSDLYSVGAVLFECLTGRRMWGGGTDLEVMRRLALEEPPRLAEAAPGVPPALAALHARLVSRKAESRPATALDVAHELRAFLGARPAASTASVAGMMRALFADEADRRRAELNAALAEVAPEDVDALRRTLDLATTLDSVTRTEALVIDSARRPESRAPPPKRRGGVLLGAAIAAAAATTVAAIAALRPTEPVAQPTPIVTVSPGLPASRPAQAMAPVAAAAPTPVAPPTASASSPTTAAARPPAPLAPGPAAGVDPRPRTKPPKPSIPPGTRPPDVDPTPF